MNEPKKWICADCGAFYDGDAACVECGSVRVVLTSTCGPFKLAIGEGWHASCFPPEHVEKLRHAWRTRPADA